MELRVLNYFLAIAREENITKAAQSLHVTQPTLSRQIAQLEEELDVQLFTRSNHHINLTEDGMILKRRAQEMLSLADKTKRELLHREDALTGEITIGSGEFQSTQFLSQLIASFREKHPLVRYEIHSGNSTNIQEYMERGLLDLGLMTEPIDIRKYDFAYARQKEIGGILVRRDSELAKKEAVTPEDLIPYPLILPSGSITNSRIEKWFGDYAGEIKLAATGNLLYNQAMMAESGIGISVGIKLECEYKNLCFVPLSPALEYGTVLAWKKEQVFSSATTAFIEHVKEYVKEYVKGIADDER